MNAIRLTINPIEMLNLGCGDQKHGVGIDILDAGQEIVWDLRKGIPLPDRSVKEFHTSHFLEHLTREDLYPLFDEIRRVAIPGAKMTIIVPHSDSDERDFLGHLSYWDEQRLRGIVLGLHGAIELVSTSRRGLELNAVLIIKE